MKECQKCHLSYNDDYFTKRKTICNSCVLLGYRVTWHKNKENSKQYYINKRKKDRVKYNKISCDKRINKRKNLVFIMGDECCRCGFDDYRALQIDHVNGGGRKELREFVKNGSITKYFEHVLESFNNNENKYQLLCANCNWIKKAENNEVKGSVSMIEQV